MFLDDDAFVVDRGLPGLWKSEYATRRLGAVTLDLPAGAGPMEFVYSHQAVEKIWQLSQRFEILWLARIIGPWIRDSLAPAIGLPRFDCTPQPDVIRYADRHPIGTGTLWWADQAMRNVIANDHGRRFVWLSAGFTTPVLTRLRAEITPRQSALIPIKRGRGIDDRAADLIYRFEDDGRANV